MIYNQPFFIFFLLNDCICTLIILFYFTRPKDRRDITEIIVNTFIIYINRTIIFNNNANYIMFLFLIVSGSINSYNFYNYLPIHKT